ncbi:MAG: hypothetical protein L0Y58_19885 [Verrucomicrobia subdivision 3 bacterium]|nr:hypothetical protein [Limisphaerales bacterium]
MKIQNSKSKIATWLVLFPTVLALWGCKNSVRQAQEEQRETARACGFKEGRGVFIGDETRRAVGVATVEVAQKAIPEVVRGKARVFAAGKASLLIDRARAALIKPGQRVLLEENREGEVISVGRAAERSAEAAEVIVKVSGDVGPPGAFVMAALPLEGQRALPAVPESSVLSTATGDYVFVQNGEHFLRTLIKPAGRADGWVGVSDGLLEGDMVVTNGVQVLWCIELQATKGGYACCAVAKEK